MDRYSQLRAQLARLFIALLGCTSLALAGAGRAGAAVPRDWKKHEFREAGVTVYLPAGELDCLETNPDWDPEDGLFSWTPEGSAEISMLMLYDELGKLMHLRDLREQTAAFVASMLEDEGSVARSAEPELLKIEGRDWMRWAAMIPTDSGPIEAVCWLCCEGNRLYSVPFYFPDQAAVAPQEEYMRSILAAIQFSAAPDHKQAKWESHELDWLGLKLSLPEGSYRDEKLADWDEDNPQDASRVVLTWTNPNLPMYNCTVLVQEDAAYRGRSDKMIEEFTADSGEGFVFDDSRNHKQYNGTDWTLLQSSYTTDEGASSQITHAFCSPNHRQFLFMGFYNPEDSVAALELLDKVLQSAAFTEVPLPGPLPWQHLAVEALGLECDIPSGGEEITAELAAKLGGEVSMKFAWSWSSDELSLFYILDFPLNEDDIAALADGDALLSEMGSALSGDDGPQMQAPASLGPYLVNGRRWNGISSRYNTGEAEGYKIAIFFSNQGTLGLALNFVYAEANEEAAISRAKEIIDSIAFPKAEQS